MVRFEAIGPDVFATIRRSIEHGGYAIDSEPFEP
jgi:hypothetical protein